MILMIWILNEKNKYCYFILNCIYYYIVNINVIWMSV